MPAFDSRQKLVLLFLLFVSAVLCVSVFILYCIDHNTNTAKDSHANQIHCVCCSPCVLPMYMHLESVLIVFLTGKFGVVLKHRMVAVHCMQPARMATQM